MNKDDFHVDDPVVVGMFFGELGWQISRYVGYLRYLKIKEYPNHKFLIMVNPQFHCLYNDFANWTIDLPQEFYDLHLDVDCYEAVLPGSPPGSFTPPDVYANLINYLRSFTDRDKTIEALPPRGYNLIFDHITQLFCKYEAPVLEKEKPIICVFPRKRVRSPQRNVPEFIWKEVVDVLSKDYIIVLSGTPSGSALIDYKGDNVINLINYNELDKLEQTIQYLNSSVVSISSQSGLTHLSLGCDCPSYIIGHEGERHTIKENHLKTPTSFRHVQDYRAIDANTIITDVIDFKRQLNEAQSKVEPNFNELLNNDIKIMNELM